MDIDARNRHSDKVNRAVQLLPMTDDDTLPAVRIGDALVFVYLDREGRLRITVDTEDMDPSDNETFPEWPDRVPLTVNVNDGTVLDRDVEI